MIIAILIFLGVFNFAMVLDYNDMYQLKKPVFIADFFGVIILSLLFVFATSNTIGVKPVETKQLTSFYSPDGNRIYCEYEKKNDFTNGGVYYCYHFITEDCKPMSITASKNFRNMSFTNCEDTKKPTVTIKRDSLYLLKKFIVGIVPIEKEYYEISIPNNSSHSRY